MIDCHPRPSSSSPLSIGRARGGRRRRREGARRRLRLSMMDINDPFISRGVNIAASSPAAAAAAAARLQRERISSAGGRARPVNCREKRTFEANGRMGWAGEGGREHSAARGAHPKSFSQMVQTVSPSSPPHDLEYSNERVPPMDGDACNNCNRIWIITNII